LLQILFHTVREMNLQNFGFYFVTNRERSVSSVQDDVRSALRAGVKLFRYDEFGISTRARVSEVRMLLIPIRKNGGKLIVNERMDIAAIAGADGVHLPVDGLPPGPVRRLMGKKIVGVEVDRAQDVKRALEGSPDYIAVGPVFPRGPTRISHAMGKDLISEIADELERQGAAGTPIIPFGGITRKNVPEIIDCNPMVESVIAINETTGVEDVYEASKWFEDYVRRFRTQK